MHSPTKVFNAVMYSIASFSLINNIFLDCKINGEISGESGPKINRKEDQSHTLHMRRQVHPMVWSGLLSAVQFHWCNMRACLFVYIYLYKSLKSPEIGIHKTINGCVDLCISAPHPISYRGRTVWVSVWDAMQAKRLAIWRIRQTMHIHSYLTLIWEYLTGQGMFQHQINVSI